MKLISVLRYCVYRLNSPLTRLPYWILLQLILWRLKRFSSIKAIYLARGMASKDFVAGISDIDLRIFLESESQRNAIYRFIHRCNFFFDFIDAEDEIVTLEEFQYRLKEFPFFTFRYLQGKASWRLVYGGDVFQNIEYHQFNVPLACYHELKFWFGHTLQVLQSKEASFLKQSNMAKCFAEVLRIEKVLDSTDNFALSRLDVSLESDYNPNDSITKQANTYLRKYLEVLHQCSPLLSFEFHYKVIPATSGMGLYLDEHGKLIFISTIAGVVTCHTLDDFAKTITINPKSLNSYSHVLFKNTLFALQTTKQRRYLSVLIEAEYLDSDENLAKISTPISLLTS
jgi:hypothetical protein